MIGTLKAGALYFVLVFAAGCVLGPIRELIVVPHLGRIAGALLEAPPMLIAMILAARWVVARFAVPAALGAGIPIGLVALAMLLGVELAGVLWLRGLSLAAYLESFGTVPGLIALALFLTFAAMPALVRPRG